MPWDKAHKVLDYYETLVRSSCPPEKFREIVAEVLTDPSSIASQPIESLGLILDSRQVKICFFCHSIKPQRDFRTLGSRACAACRAPANRGYQKRWASRNLEARRRHMEEYRTKKNGTFL